MTEHARSSGVPGSRAGGALRPRYDRIAAAASAFVVTGTTLLGGAGVLPGGPSSAAAAGAPSAGVQARLATVTIPDGRRQARSLDPGDETPGLPEGSGTGRRVVFDIGDQRVWLVDGSEEVRRTYLVSGSLTDNLRPGTFEVFSRSRHAVGIDDSGEMEYFVRFTRGERAAIGFHSIPTQEGEPLQSRAQLGTPQSHGCIRQAASDARRLWAFAPVGTKVVVTA